MKLSLLLLSLLLLVESVFASGEEFPYFETYSVPKDSSTVFYVDFKITYDKLFFEKTNSGYRANCSVGIEIYGNDSLVYRKYEQKSVFAKSFTETKDGDKFLHRFFSAELKNGNYSVKFHFQILNAPAHTINFTKEISINGKPAPVLKPVVATEINDNVFLTVSLNTQVPFSKENYDLVIPVFSQDSVKKITLKQSGEKIGVFKTAETIPGAPAFALIGNRFVLTPKKCLIGYRLFIVRNFSAKLIPGIAYLEVQTNKSDFTFPIKITWGNAPKSLRAPRIALSAMENLFPEKKLAEYEEAEENAKTKILFDLWKKVDPDTSNSYNEIMTEFFRRVDYSNENFSQKKLRGYKTDRGTIYIRYGKPLKISRDFTTYDLRREIWDYGSFKFIFVDEKGNGDYKLMEKQ